MAYRSHLARDHPLPELNERRPRIAGRAADLPARAASARLQVVGKLTMVCVCLLAGACSAASGLAGSPSETTVRGGGREVRISLEDAHQLRGALLQALKNTELQEGPRLLASAQALPAWIDADGRVMISGWLLQFRKGEPALAYRETHDASHATAYSAQIGGKRDGWSVGPIGKESIHLLPR